MRRIEDALRRHAEDAPSRVALCDGASSYTYASLLEAVTLRAKELGAKKGRGVAIRASQTAAFVIDYLAIHEAGGVAVPLESDVPESAFRKVCQLVEGETFGPDMADVLFTTGTTGRQKGVMIPHRAIVADAENLAEAQQYASGVTFIASGPLNHIGTLSKFYPTLLVGGTFAVVDGLRNPNAFFGVAERAEGKVATFQVPATLRMMLSLYRDKLASLADKFDFIETGAAPMALADMQLLCQTLPHTRLYNTYASTETGIVATHDYAAGPCEPGCLGRAMRHSKIAIATDGHIVCEGDTLMGGYLGDDALTASVLRGGQLHTADIGYLDGEGRLRLTGRTDDTINVGGYKVAPSEVEDIVLGFEGVEDCICVAAPHPMMGQALKLLVVTRGGAPLDKRALALHVKAHAEAYKVPLLYEKVEAIRRTYNGKLDRKAYRF